MEYQPLYDRILIEPVQDDGTKGKIIIPDSTKEKPIEGTVIMAGEGYRSENGSITPLRVKVGDTVVYGKWSGTEVKLNSKDYVVIKESDLLLVKSKKM